MQGHGDSPLFRLSFLLDCSGSGFRLCQRRRRRRPFSYFLCAAFSSSALRRRRRRRRPLFPPFQAQ